MKRNICPEAARTPQAMYTSTTVTGTAGGKSCFLTQTQREGGREGGRRGGGSELRPLGCH